MKSVPESVREYIQQFPPPVRKKLVKLRKTILEAAPGAAERISYRMPGFDLGGILVWFAAYENHIGLYPTGEGIRQFQAELSNYKSAKGSVQFPIDEEPPYELVRRIVKYRVARNQEKAEAKAKAKSKAKPTRRA